MTSKQKSNLTQSDEDPEDEERGSVFDFLYADHNRLASYLSQFHDYGHLTGISRDKSAQRGKSDNGQTEVEGSALVVKGKARYQGSTSASHSEARRDTFDPTWQNALLFLDECERRNLVLREITDANLGNIVLLSGSLAIKDLSLVGKTVKLPVFKHLAEMGFAQSNSSQNANRQQRRASNKKGNKTSDPSELDLFVELTNILPHPAQMTIKGAATAWGVLQEDALVSAVSDFSVKYGGQIPGNWVVVGVLDALPDHEVPSGAVVQTQSLAEIAGAMLGILEPLVRQYLGRPVGAYGITPLMIFREVGQRQSSAKGDY